MTRVGVVGVGRVGRAVVARLVSAGHDVYAWDIRPETAASLPREARFAHTLDEALGKAHVLLTALPGSPELGALMIGEQALLSQLDGTTWIDLGSTAPPLGRELADAARARDVPYLDAPIGGGPDAVRAGEATLYVGGDPAVIDLWRDLLHSFAGRVEHVGGNGAGYLTKLLINLLWFSQAVTTGEALLIARGSGLDVGRFARALSGSAASSEFVSSYLPRLLDGDYAPNFGLQRCVEELDAITGLAREMRLPTAVTEAVARVHHEALDRYGPVDGELLAVAHLERAARDQLERPSTR